MSACRGDPWQGIRWEKCRDGGVCGLPCPMGACTGTGVARGMRRAQAWKSALHKAGTNPSPAGEKHGGILQRRPPC